MTTHAPSCRLSAAGGGTAPFCVERDLAPTRRRSTLRLHRVSGCSGVLLKVSYPVAVVEQAPDALERSKPWWRRASSPQNLTLITILVSLVALVPDWAQFLKPDRRATQAAPANPNGGEAPTSEPRGTIAAPKPWQEGIMSPLDVEGSAWLPRDQALWPLLVAPNNLYYTTTSKPGPIGTDGRGQWLVQDVGMGHVSPRRRGRHLPVSPGQCTPSG